MRVVFLNPTGQIGGAERLLLNLFQGFEKAELPISPHLIAAAPGPLVEAARRRGVPTRVLAFNRHLATLGDAGADGLAGKQVTRGALAARLLAAAPETWLYSRRLRRELRGGGATLIHSNGLKMHLLACRSRPAGVPVLWHLHDYVGLRPLMGGLLRRLAPSVDAAIANSHSVAADFRNRCGDRPPVTTVYNAVDLETFTPEGPALDLDRLAGLPPAPPGTVRVGLVATMGRWKGHATFLQALAGLAPEIPVRGYVVGGAVYTTAGSQFRLEELRDAAQRLGLGHRVGFTGLVAEPAQAMRALDVVVHASIQPEPFGMVIAEAMGCGRAVIASLAGGAAELVAPERDALAHPPGDAGALQGAIARLAADRDLRRRLGRAARATAEERFGLDRLAREVLSVYRRTTSR